jgi:hypothetical protein
MRVMSEPKTEIDEAAHTRTNAEFCQIGDLKGPRTGAA